MAKKPTDTATAKESRPQNKRLKPLGTGRLTPEEEFAIRSKGGKAAAAKRKAEEFPIGAVLSKLLSKGMKPGPVTVVDEIESIADLEAMNPSGKAYIGLAELKRYLATGDKECRDFIWRKVEEHEQQERVQEIATRLSESGVCISADKLALLTALQKQGTDKMLLVAVAAALGMEIPDLSGDSKKKDEPAQAGVHIHLTRGDKPADGGAKATPAVLIGTDPDESGDES